MTMIPSVYVNEPYDAKIQLTTVGNRTNGCVAVLRVPLTPQNTHYGGDAEERTAATQRAVR
jgi:hypothetical protein